MQKEEMIAFLERIRGFYPGFKIDTLTAESWYSVLGEHQASQVFAALQSYSRENKFPPTVSGIISCLPNGQKVFVPNSDRPLPKLQENLIRVYYTNPDGREVYAIQNKFGTFKRAMQEEKTAGPLADVVQSNLEKIQERRDLA